MSDASEPSIGKLVTDVSRDVSELVRAEIALAKSELKFSVRAGGTAIAAFALAVFLLLIVVILASMTVAYFLTMTGMHVAWAFLIVTGLYILAAVLLVLFGYFRVKKVRLPEKTIATAKAIPSTFKQD